MNIMFSSCDKKMFDEYAVQLYTSFKKHNNSGEHDKFFIEVIKWVR